MNYLWLFGKSPGFYTIMNPETHEASEIYSEDGVLIGKFFNENRTPVKYEEVNPAFWNALIDTEDERFYNHMSFYSYNDLILQMRRYLNRSNNIPMQVLGWKSPLEKRLELETQ